MSYRFHHGTVAGTFDHLHAGHKKIIDTAFSQSEIVSVGIADSSFAHKEFVSQILSYDERKKEVEAYLVHKNYMKRARLFKLTDIYGSAKDDTTLQALFVTRETYQNSLKVNQLRKKNGLSSLKLIVIPFMKSHDRKIIRSTRIRRGEIDREGYLFKNIFKKNILHLPEGKRESLRVPIGKVFTGKEENKKEVARTVAQYILRLKPSFIISVGDIVTLFLQDEGIVPPIAIVDFKTQRKSLSKEERSQLSAPFGERRAYRNKAGTISGKMANIFITNVHKYFKLHVSSQIKIQGEEDLLALPAILLAPLGSVVVYGQKDLGVVVVEVTEEKKEEVRKLVEKFE